MERWTRRDLLAAIAIAPLAALPLRGSAQEQAATLKGRNRIAAEAVWPDKEVKYHHFPKIHGRPDSMVDFRARPLNDSLMGDIARAQKSPVYIGIGGDDDAGVAQSFHSHLTYRELTLPLQLHVVFIGNAKVGEVLRKHLGPVLAELRVVTLPRAG